MQAMKIKKQKLSCKLTPSDSEEKLDTHASCSTSNTDSKTIHFILFERIFSEMVYPKLPNTSWAIHRSMSPDKTIVASQIGIINAEIPPLYTKQVVFDREMNFEVFFMNTRTVLKNKPKAPQTSEEFEQTVSYINEIKLCPGGPAVVEYSNIDLECAYKDPTERWRHNLCSLETYDESICKFCISLEEILQKSLQKTKLSGKTLNNSRKRKRKVGLRRGKRT